jgi:membrane-associated phospholipid phosphatase
MGGIIDLGIELILFLQSVGAWLRGPMVVLSYLGTEPFFLLIAPIFLWCIDAGWGLRIGLALTLSNTLNAVFKMVIQGPRPYWIDDRVLPWSAETTFGAPSGHAQNAAAVWGVLAAWAPRAWIRAGAIVLMILIGLSRLFLGMHFPHDVLLGWGLGLVVLAAILLGERALRPWLARGRPAEIILAAFAVALALILLTAGARQSAVAWVMPDDWAQRAALAPNAAPITPLSLEGAISSAAAFFGMAAGGVLLKQRGWFDTRGPLEKLALRYLLGLLGMLAFYAGLDAIFPEGETLVAAIFRFIRYTLVGLWVAFLAPEVFIRLRLAERGQPPAKDVAHGRPEAA